MTKCRACGAATDAFLCQSDANKLEQALAELPAGIRDLEITATRQARVGNLPAPPKPDVDPDPLIGPLHDTCPHDSCTRIRHEMAAAIGLTLPAHLRTRDARVALVATDLPLAPAAALLHARAVNAIGTWIRHLCETRGIDPPTATRGTWLIRSRLYIAHNRMHVREPGKVFVPLAEQSVTVATSWLMTNLDAIRMDEAAAEIHTKVLALTAQIAATVDRQDPGVFAGPCNAPDVRVIVDGDGLRPVVSTCGADVMAKAGEPVATCSACGMAYDLAERKAWLLSQMPDHVATSRDIANALTSIDAPLTSAMIRKMVFSREILPRGTDAKGHATFRVGDVLDVLARRAERKSRNGRMSA
jgi:hypothetical protein